MWFGNRASRRSRAQTKPPQEQSHKPPDTETVTALTDSSVFKHPQSISTLEPPATFSPPSSQSGILLSDVHANINDSNSYGTANLNATLPVGVRAGEDLDESAEALANLDLDNTHPVVDQLESKKDKGKGRETEGPLFTPQDAVLTEVFGFPLPAGANHDAGTTTVDSDSMPPLGIPTSRLAPLPPLPMYDPFTGARIGDHTPLAASTATANTTSTAGVDQQQNKPHCPPVMGDPDLWGHLARILELQAEVAGMHTEMEGIGVSGKSSAGAGLGGSLNTNDTHSPGVNTSNPKRRTRGPTMPIGDDDEPPSQSRGADGDPSSEDEDEDDSEGFSKRKRDEDFAKLADQFSERKAAITRIMSKVKYFDPSELWPNVMHGMQLDDLSTALKAFHAHPTPHMDLGPKNTSRANTISSVTSGATNASSPPPHHTRFFQTAATSNTAHVRPTLASVSSKPPQPPDNLISDAQHVDSPLDMHPTQSVFK